MGFRVAGQRQSTSTLEFDSTFRIDSKDSTNVSAVVFEVNEIELRAGPMTIRETHQHSLQSLGDSIEPTVG